MTQSSDQELKLIKFDELNPLNIPNLSGTKTYRQIKQIYKLEGNSTWMVDCSEISIKSEEGILANFVIDTDASIVISGECSSF